jgi:hypothetical protein
MLEAPLIVPIVEGYAEVHSVPLIVRRWAVECGGVSVRVRSPIRAPGKGGLTTPNGIERFVSLATKVPGCSAILVLLDADDKCPKVEAPALMARALTRCHGIPLAVVEANRQFETWIAASSETVRGHRDLPADLTCPLPAEDIPNPKAWLDAAMPPGRKYRETMDQPALTDHLDFALVRSRCDSFDKLLRSLASLIPTEG